MELPLVSEHDYGPPVGKIKLPFTYKMCLFQSERAGVSVMGTSLKSTDKLEATLEVLVVKSKQFFC